MLAEDDSLWLPRVHSFFDFIGFLLLSTISETSRKHFELI